MNEIESIFNTLVESVSSMNDVLSIGRSGGRPLPASSADGDIDVFIYCSTIPGEEKRRAALSGLADRLENVRIGAFGGGHWGTGDFASIGGIETWLMYFTEAEALAEIESILNGDRPSKVDNYYYPTGRCAMFLGMEILCDKAGFLSSMKARLSVYPEALSEKLVRVHLAALGDTEDIERAAVRKDVLFYHSAFDIALDHFLQALFAMNKVYFPSRKRSLEQIGKFSRKPAGSGESLLEVIRLGGCPESIGRSLELWRELVKELLDLNG